VVHEGGRVVIIITEPGYLEPHLLDLESKPEILHVDKLIIYSAVVGAFLALQVPSSEVHARVEDEQASVGDDATAATNGSIEDLKLRGDLRAAALRYKVALQKDPDQPELRLKLGRIYFKLAEWQAAEKEYQRAIDSGVVELNEVIEEQVRSRLYRGDTGALTESAPDATVLSIRQIVGDDDSKAAELMALYGHAFYLRGDLDKAERMYALARQANASIADVFLGDAMLAASRADYEEMRSALNSALGIDPEFAAGWSYMGDLERYQGNLDAAERAYDKAISLRYNNGHDLFGRALVRIAANDLDAARDDAAEARVALRGSPAAHYLDGLIALKEGRDQRASEAFAASIAKEGGYLPAELYAGLTAASLGSLEQALEYLSRFLSQRPSNLIALTALAAVQLGLNESQDAQKTIERLLMIAPNDQQALDLAENLTLWQAPGSRSSQLLRMALDEQPAGGFEFLKLDLAFVPSRLSQALSRLEDAAKDDSDNLEVQLALVVALVKNNQLDDALRRVDELLERMPENAILLSVKGRVALLMGNEEDAATLFQRALDINPADFRSASSLAALALKGGDLGKARSYYESVLNADPGQLRAGLALARIAERQGKSDEAQQILSQLIEDNPEALQPRIGLAQFYRVQGRGADAVKLLRPMTEKYKDAPLLWQELAAAQFAVGEIKAAQRSLRNQLYLTPADAEAMFQLAKLYAADAQDGAAQVQLQELLRVNPSHRGAKLVIARMALDNGDVDLAARLADELVAVRPADVDAVQLQGAVAVKRKQAKLAVARYSAAVQLAPRTETVTQLAMAAIAVGQPEGALTVMQNWLELNPDDAVMRRNLANAANVLGKSELAVTQYRVLVDQNAADAMIYNNLALALMRDDPDAALSYAQTGVDKFPDSPALRNTLGLIQLQLGQPALAAAELDQAVTAAPLIPSYRFHLAVAMERVGRVDDAKAILSELLTSDVEFSEREVANGLLERLHAGGQATSSPLSDHPR